MSNELREAAQQARDALKYLITDTPDQEMKRKRAIDTLDAALAQPETGAICDYDKAQPVEQDLNRGLLQATRQALAALNKHAFLPWGQPGYPTPTPGADLIYEAKSYLKAALKKEPTEQGVEV